MTKPDDASWVSAYQPISFGIDDPLMGGFPFHFNGVINTNGKAKFQAGSNIYGTCPGKYLYIASGTYIGTHTIVSIDDSGNILTNTDYVSDTTGHARVLANHIYRIWYGYPTQTSYIDVKPFWDISDNTLVVDLQEYLKSVFTVAPPTAGYDNNMYTHFRVQIKPAADYSTFMAAIVTATGLTEDQLMKEYTAFNWELDAYKWFLLNGVLAHADLQDLIGDDELQILSIETPVTFANFCSIVSKIRGDRVYNIITCFGDGVIPTLTIIPETLADATIGAAYTGVITASGGVAPYTYDVVTGTLPSWATLNPSTGYITGTPTIAESATFTIRATDSTGAYADIEYTLDSAYDAEILNLISRVQALGSDVTGTLLDAYVDFVNSVSSIRSKILRLNMFAADSYAGILAPLFRNTDGSGTAVGGNADTNVNFVSGDWGLATGLQGDGSSKYLNTGLNPSSTTEIGQNNTGIGAWIGTVNNGRFAIGVGDGGTNYLMLAPAFTGYTGNVIATVNTNNVGSGWAAQTPGMLYLSRLASGTESLYKDGVLVSDRTLASTSELNANIYIFMDNNINLFGSNWPTSDVLFGYVITQGMSAAEQLVLYNAWNTFNTAIGR